MDKNKLIGLGISEEQAEAVIKLAEENLAITKEGTGGEGNFARKNLLAANPWKKISFNLTEQGQLLKTNPELAKAYMQQS